MARSCSTRRRLVRGAVGGVAGGVVGALIGGGIMLGLMVKARNEPIEEAFNTLAWGPISLWGLGVTGLGLGAYLGARKC